MSAALDRESFRPSSAAVTGVILLSTNRVPGHSSRDAALLSDVAHVPFIHVEDQAVGVERDSEQGLPFSTGEPSIGSIAGNDRAVERLHDPGPCKVVLGKRQLRFSLSDLKLQDDEIGAFMVGKCVALSL